MERAHALGYSALALTHECCLASIVRAHVAAQEVRLPLLVGAQFEVPDAAPFNLVVLAQDLNGCGNLCQFITHLRRTSEKGTYRLALKGISSAALADCLAVVSPSRQTTAAQREAIGRWALGQFAGRCWLGLVLPRTLADGKAHTQDAVRLGLRYVAGLKGEAAQRIVEARKAAPFDNAEDLARRAGLERHEMKLLAAADALMSLSGHRQQQVWDAAALYTPPKLLRDAVVDEDVVVKQ